MYTGVRRFDMAAKDSEFALADNVVSVKNDSMPRMRQPPAE
jgi:hypothetical protein